MTGTPFLVQSVRNTGASIHAGHGTRPKRVFTAGANGSRVDKIMLSTNDAGANLAHLFALQPVTAVGVSPTGAVTFVDGGGGSDTITRVNNSFITDGWRIGDQIFPNESTTLANDFLARLTAVAALTLTFATATVNTGEVLAAGNTIYRATEIGTAVVPIGAGTLSGVPPINLMDYVNFPALRAQPYDYHQLGALAGFAVSMGTLMGAGEYVDVTIEAGDY